MNRFRVDAIVLAACFISGCGDGRVPDPGSGTPPSPLDVGSGEVQNKMIEGPCGSVSYSVRIHTPSRAAVTGDTVILLTGFPGDLYWFDKYAGQSQPGSDEISYDHTTNGYQIGERLFDAGFRVIEHHWDPLRAPVTRACAGRPLAFMDAHQYARTFIEEIFNQLNVPPEHRFLVGHSWGAMTIGALELPTLALPIARSVQIAPSGADLFAGCHTERDTSRPLCADDRDHCRYFGGWANFFPLFGTDDYNITKSGVFNPFLAAKTVFGLENNCRDAALGAPAVDTTLKANSLNFALVDAGTTDLAAGDPPNGTGHDSLIATGTYDWGYGSISSYVEQRQALHGNGPTPLVIEKGTHSFNGWPADSVDEIVDYVTIGTRP